MEWVIYNCNSDKRYEEVGGLPDSDNRYSYCVLAVARNDRKEAQDMMVHAAANLYLVAMKLLKMGKFNERKDF